MKLANYFIHLTFADPVSISNQFSNLFGFWLSLTAKWPNGHSADWNQSDLQSEVDKQKNQLALDLMDQNMALCYVS